MNAMVLVQRESLKQALIDRARVGDRQATEDLLTVCLDDLKGTMKACGGVEFEDVYQEAALAVWEVLPEALVEEHPSVSLSVAALSAIRKYCVKFQCQRMVSLDAIATYSYLVPGAPAWQGGVA
jgi:hypothetical protein